MRILSLLTCLYLIAQALLLYAENSFGANIDAISSKALNKPPQVFSSKATQVSLIELFTSEGCSSCPPADRWLSNLKDETGLFQDFIPMAFHVDYWNYLGWRDNFAQSSYSSRQRVYKQQGHVSSVYTPGFVINGQEWRGFFNLLGRKIPITGNQPVGRLQLTLNASDAILRFTPLTPALKNHAKQLSANLAANLVYLGTNIKNIIKAGENHGKTLQHDFVVLDQQTSHETTPNLWLFNHEPPKGATAIAAWISKQSDLKPIQAVAGWLLP